MPNLFFKGYISFSNRPSSFVHLAGGAGLLVTVASALRLLVHTCKAKRNNALVAPVLKVAVQQQQQQKQQQQQQREIKREEKHPAEEGKEQRQGRQQPKHLHFHHHHQQKQRQQQQQDPQQQEAQSDQPSGPAAASSPSSSYWSKWGDVDLAFLLSRLWHLVLPVVFVASIAPSIIVRQGKRKYCVFILNTFIQHQVQG